MPRFYFHIRSDFGFAPDEEGRDLPDGRAAVEEALRAARYIMRAPTGQQHGAWRGWIIQVADYHGGLVFVLPFSSVLEISKKDRKA
ncbi:MAG TPA: hypothetical protein VHL98_18520 [Microvirga sp.]|jgi:hypothetical protein|nr:hypothetical protein [Microvirga sp.]